MRFNVPQFIDIEDKIIGPFTLKQFLFLLAGGAVLLLLWFIIPNFFIFIFIGLPILILSLALAFYKVDNWQPFILYLGSMFKFFSRPRLYLWKRENKEKE
ncbi:PrgI family mobile element protein [Patescibacteria group bacterium]